MQEKGARVIPFPPGGKAGRNFRRRDNPAEPETERSLSPETVVALLGSVAPMGAGLISLLQLPERLYKIETSDGYSFSSASGSSIVKVAGSLIRGFPMPSSFADYGIDVCSKGGSSFCTFVDRSRGVIVCAEIQSMHSEEGSWDGFETALRDALSAASSKKAEKIPFSFVVNKEGLVSIVE